MRRTELKRGKPMARGAGLQRRGELERTGGLKPRSAKTARKYVARRALVAELFLYPTACEVPWCDQRATDPHEPKTRARGGSILDRANVRLICSLHHREIHDNEPKWAYKHGFLKRSGKSDDGTVRPVPSGDGAG